MFGQLRAVERQNKSEADKYPNLHDVSCGFGACYGAHVFTLPLLAVKRKVLQLLYGKEGEELYFLRYLSAITWKNGD